MVLRRRAGLRRVASRHRPRTREWSHRARRRHGLPVAPAGRRGAVPTRPAAGSSIGPGFVRGRARRCRGGPAGAWRMVVVARAQVRGVLRGRLTERVYLHVGAPKSGTTYLQPVLRPNRQRAGRPRVCWSSATSTSTGCTPAMVVREDPRLSALPDAAARAGSGWSSRSGPGGRRRRPQLRAVRRRDGGAGGARDRRPARRRGARRDHRPRPRPRVPSAWQERLKFALTTPLRGVAAPRPRGRPAVRVGLAHHGPGRRGRAVGRRACRRSGSTSSPCPASGREPDELWHRFADACGLPRRRRPGAAARAREQLARRGRGRGAAPGQRGPGPDRGHREQARWLRDTLAHEVLAGLDDEPMGLTDQQFEEAARRAGRPRAADRGRAAGYDVRGDLADLARRVPPAARPRTSATPSSSTPRSRRSCGSSAGARAVRERDAARSETPRRGRPSRVRRNGVVRRVTAQHVDRRPTRRDAPDRRAGAGRSRPTGRCTCGSPRSPTW